MREYFAVLERAGLPMNAVQTVGHTQVRMLTVGLEDRQATPEQMGHMKALVREAIERAKKHVRALPNRKLASVQN